MKKKKKGFVYNHLSQVDSLLINKVASNNTELCQNSGQQY